MSSSRERHISQICYSLLADVSLGLHYLVCTEFSIKHQATNHDINKNKHSGRKYAVNSTTVKPLSTTTTFRSIVLQITYTMPKKDGRWGWVVVAACFVNCVIYGGMSYSFGIMFVEILDAFKESKSFTAGIAGLMHGMTIIGPLAGWFTNKYGCRVAVVLGGLMSSVGYIASAWSTGVLFLYISIGLIAGFGLTVMDFARNVVIVQWFKKKRSLAYGITSFGTGIGSIAFYPISRWLIDTYGWRGTLLIEGGLSLNCAVMGLLMRPLTDKPVDEIIVRSKKKGDVSKNEIKMEEKELINHNETETAVRGSNDVTALNGKVKLQVQTPETKRNLKFSLLKQPPFLIYLLGGLCSGLSYQVPFTFIPDLSISTGYTKTQAMFVMTAIGIANTATRIPFGLIMDSKYLNRTLISALCSILAGVIVATMPYLPHYRLFLTVCAVYGFFCATVSVLGTLVTADLFGDKLIADTRGFLVFFFGIGNLVSEPLSGFLFDVTGSYKAAFIFCGVTFSLEGVVRIYLYILFRNSESLVDLNKY